MSKPSVRPDFMIIGAMKCGTTSLHKILDQHPDVFMPGGEVKFFTIDDFEQQRQFFPKTDQGWVDHDYKEKYGLYCRWYEELYEGLSDELIKGEDVPSYLPSKKAPSRIADLFPEVKLIAILRDPVDRAYSHYWHNIRSYNEIYRFDDALRHSPKLLIDRSCYKSQILRYLDYFDREQLLVVLFEQFTANPVKTVREVSEFIGIPEQSNFDFVPAHANKSNYPKYPAVLRLRNFLFRKLYGLYYFEYLPDMPKAPTMNWGERRLLGALMRLTSELI